jgi:hypothetical protein
MNEKQKVKDMIRKALDERTPEPERIVTAFKALAFIVKYDLLDDGPTMAGAAGKAAVIIDTVTNPDFVENIVARAEKVASGFERIVGSAKKVAGASGSGRSRSVSEGGRRGRYRR